MNLILKFFCVDEIVNRQVFVLLRLKVYPFLYVLGVSHPQLLILMHHLTKILCCVMRIPSSIEILHDVSDLMVALSALHLVADGLQRRHLLPSWVSLPIMANMQELSIAVAEFLGVHLGHQHEEDLFHASFFLWAVFYLFDQILILLH